MGSPKPNGPALEGEFNKPRPVLRTTVVIASLYVPLRILPAPGDAWAVPEGLGHPWGVPEGTPGLRLVNALEWCFLSGAPGCSILVGCLVMLSVWFRSHDDKSSFLVTATAAVLLTLIAFLEAPIVRHRCMSPMAICRSQLKNIGTAMSMFKEEKGHYPERLEQISPKYLMQIPKCPISGLDFQSELSADSYLVRCGPHPRYYSGNDLTILGKSYLSLESRRRTLTFSSDEGFVITPGD